MAAQTNTAEKHNQPNKIVNEWKWIIEWMDVSIYMYTLNWARITSWWYLDGSGNTVLQT